MLLSTTPLVYASRHCPLHGLMLAHLLPFPVSPMSQLSLCVTMRHYFSLCVTMRHYLSLCAYTVVQLVWGQSASVGCANVTCPASVTGLTAPITMWACEYSPRGTRASASSPMVGSRFEM